MNDAFFVCGFKCFADATGNGQCFRNRNRTAPDSLDKRLAFDELKHEKARVVDFCDIVDGGNVGMVQRSEQLRFALESAGTVEVARKFLRQDFDGDVTLQFVVFGTIDLTHTALAEQRRDFVRAELLANLKRHQLRVFYGSGTSGAMSSSGRVTVISETEPTIRSALFVATLRDSGTHQQPDTPLAKPQNCCLWRTSGGSYSEVYGLR